MPRGSSCTRPQTQLRLQSDTIHWVWDSRHIAPINMPGFQRPSRRLGKTDAEYHPIQTHAAAQRNPQFDTIDLALPFIATAVLCVGVRIDDDPASLIILTSLVILCARARVGDHDSPNAPDNHRRFGIGVAIFLLIFVG